MLLRNTRLFMLALGLFTATFLAQASPDRTGIIRTVNLANNYIVIDAQRYQVNEHTRVVNLAGSNNGLQSLQTGYPVAFSVEHGRVEKITIYPTDPGTRQRLGYRDETTFPQ